MIQTILTFILVFSVLVVIHEWGHFYFAKRAGILVREFAIGMGPKVFSSRKNGTTYTIRMLPLGGYVRMAGYGDEDTELKPGMPLRIVLDEKNQVQKIVTGDTEAIHAVPIELTSYDLEKELFLEGRIPGKDVPQRFLVKREATIIEADGTEVQVAPIDVQFQSASLKDRMLTNFAGPLNNFILGILVFSLLAFLQGGVLVDENRLGDVQTGSPAETAGLQKDDVILAVDGEAIDSWTDLVLAIQGRPEQPVELLVQRGEAEPEPVTVIPDAQTDEAGNTYGLIGVTMPMEASFGAKIAFGFQQTWTIITSIFTLLGSMLTRGFQLDAFGGPVAIYAATEEVVSYGWMSILSFLGSLSVNLGTVNLLPIPGLDGGKLLLNIVEGIRRKPLEPDKEGIINLIGIGLLLVLMVFITWNDIQRFFFN